MIRVILLGRTGNNLFQYALGRVLAEKHGVELVLGAQWFNSDGWQEVSQFLRLPIKAKVARRWSLGARAWRKVTGRHPWESLPVPIIEEPSGFLPFNPDILSAPAACLLKGYFQSPRYFASMENELRLELRGLLGLPAELEGRSGPGVAAVHVRRTDFLNHPDLQTCDLDYYCRAMDVIRERVPGVAFHVYSDDPAWCQANFTDADVKVASVTGGTRHPLADLMAMSRAEHHVMANSTYSWWAAWLARRAGQQVIMPRQWSRSVPDAGTDRCLDGWEMI